MSEPIDPIPDVVVEDLPEAPKFKYPLQDPKNRNRNGGKKGTRKPPEYLRDLRYVYRNADASKDSRGQAALRVMFQEEPARFMDRLNKAEFDFRRVWQKKDSERAEREEPAGNVLDLGAARVVELIDQLLQGYSA